MMVIKVGSRVFARYWSHAHTMVGPLATGEHDFVVGDRPYLDANRVGSVMPGSPGDVTAIHRIRGAGCRPPLELAVVKWGPGVYSVLRSVHIGEVGSS